MKPIYPALPRHFIFIVLIVLLSYGLPAVADDDLDAYAAQCDAPLAMHDLQVKADTFADPEKFKQLLTVLRKPATTKAMMQCMLNPEQRDTVLAGIINPVNVSSAMLSMANPKTCADWTVASMRPDTYASFAGFMNPMSFMQWMSGMTNVAVYQPALSELKQVH